MIKVAIPPAGNVGGEKRFETPISCTCKRVTASTTFVRSWSVWNELAGIRFVYVPCSFEITLTLIVQVEFGAMLPLFKVTEVPPIAAESVAEAPHPLNVGETGSARKTLGGRSSVNDAPVNAIFGS